MINPGAAKPGTFLEDLNPPQVPHLEDYFQFEEKAVFFPTTQNLVSMDNIVLLLLGMKLLKTNPQLFKEIVVTYLKSCTEIIKAMEQACHGSSATAVIINNTTLACMLHRLGMIDNGGYLKIVDQNKNIFDKQFWKSGAEAALTGITTLVQGSTSRTETSAGKEGPSMKESTKGLADIAALITGALKA